jgi:hypothetical protein
VAARRNGNLKADVLVTQVLESARATNGRKLAAWRQPKRDLERVVRRDYASYVRRNLGYRELTYGLKLAERVWPILNHKNLSAASEKNFPRQAGKMAHELGCHFQARPFDGPDGLALRGFYVKDAKTFLKRPLIYVNTAHHPAAVSSSFLHELGHHLFSSIIFGVEAPLHFFFDCGYADHLDNAAELGADALVSIAGYPARVARRIFAEPWNWGLVAHTGKLSEAAFSQVREHVGRRYGLDSAARIPPGQEIHYLTGMIHYAKLRWALLAEYDL